MGGALSSGKAAKVEGNYQVTEPQPNSETTHLETHTNSSQKEDSDNSSKSLKADAAQPSKLKALPSKSNPSKDNPKDDSDWTPTIDTDIYNEKGGGRLTTKAEDNNADQQILV